MELEDVYKNGTGPHRGITFADWCGLLIGYGLEAYRIGHTPRQEEVPESCGGSGARGSGAEEAAEREITEGW
jgi:hypothetical protein